MIETPYRSLSMVKSDPTGKASLGQKAKLGDSKLVNL